MPSIAFRPRTSRSRFARSPETMRVTGSCDPVSAASPACCTNVAVQETLLMTRVVIGSASRAGMTPYPSRHPVIEYRSEEHTSELQSRLHLECRLLLEKKKKNRTIPANEH